MVTTHARFAMKVQHKLRNGVAGRIISGSAESGQNLPISAMLLDPQNVRAEMPAEIDQLGIAGAAAQTRMVSAGEFWPSQQELSRDLNTWLAHGFLSSSPTCPATQSGLCGICPGCRIMCRRGRQITVEDFCDTYARARYGVLHNFGSHW